MSLIFKTHACSLFACPVCVKGFNRVTELNLRPLLYVAGAAATAVGLCYLYRRLADQQPRRSTVDAAFQTEAEGSRRSSMNGTEADPVHVMPQCSGEMRSSYWTLRISHRRWCDRQIRMVSVKRDFVLLTRGAVTQSCWTLTNNFFKPTSEGLFRYSSVHRVTLALHIDGRLARVISYNFTERILKTCRGDHGVPVKKWLWKHKGFVIGHDGCLVSVPGGTDLMVRDPETPGGASAPEAAAEGLSVEEREVPAVFYFCRTKGIEYVLLKLTALRKASTILLSQPQTRTFLEMSGRKILGELARANGKDVTAFQEMYDNLLLEIQQPHNRIWIDLELAQIGIQHFNFIDVIFELVLLGIWGRVRVFQSCGVYNGFLDYVMEVISYCTASKWRRSNGGSRLILSFQAEMLLLLEEIFQMDDDLYMDPESLATALWSTLKFHIRQFLNNLEKSQEAHQFL